MTMKLIFRIALLQLLLIQTGCYHKTATEDFLLLQFSDVKFRIGDNLHWAEPNLDDSTWKKSSLPHFWKNENVQIPQNEFCGKGWYRITFDRPDNPDKTNLAFYLGRSFTMTEVYFNGHRLGANLPSMNDKNVFYYPEYSTPIVYSIDENWWNDGKQVIAIRQFLNNNMGGIMDFPIGIGLDTKLINHRTTLRTYEIIVQIVNIVLVAHWLLIFILLAPQEKSRPGFRTTLVFLGLTLIAWILFFPGWKIPISKTTELILGFTAQFALAGIIYCIPLMMYQLLEISYHRRMAIYAGLILIWFIPGCLFRYFFPVFIIKISIFYCFPLVLIFGFFYCIQACWYSFRVKNQDAIYFGIGITSLMIFTGYDILQGLVPIFSLHDKWDVPIGRYGDLISLTLIGHFIFINALGLGLLLRFRAKQKTITNLSNKVISAESTERQRVSRELHDGITQSLQTLKMQSDLIQLDSHDDSKFNLKISSIAEGLETAIGDLRQVATNMRPIEIEKHGFIKALKRFVDDISTNTSIEIKLDIKSDITLSDSAENHLYRMIQEATQNAIKHSNCHFLSIAIEQKADKTYFYCEDDGDGFTIDELNSASAFNTLKERTEILDGICNIRSNSGEGTTIAIRF